MSSVAAQPSCCVLVLVVYLKIKKNKFLKQKQVAIQGACCVLLRELFVKHVVVLAACCVFLLVPEV